VGRGLRGALLMSTGLLAVACGSAVTQTFHPAGGKSASAASSPGPTSSAPSATGSESLTFPPFGKNAHIDMTSWLPANASEIRAVTTAKDFLLAVLYADYKGGRDHRWARYASSQKVKTGLASTLAQPGVTTESFRGTIRFWHMSALAVYGSEGNGRGHRVRRQLACPQHEPDHRKGPPRRKQTPRDQNFYSNSDVLAKDSSGHWRVISIPPTIYYPQALECKE
jgi:hypothetical protein